MAQRSSDNPSAVERQVDGKCLAKFVGPHARRAKRENTLHIPVFHRSARHHKKPVKNQ